MECDSIEILIAKEKFEIFRSLNFHFSKLEKLKPLRDDSALGALSTLRGLRGAPEVPPLCRKTQSLGQQMLNASVGINGLMCQEVCDTDS